MKCTILRPLPNTRENYWIKINKGKLELLITEIVDIWRILITLQVCSINSHFVVHLLFKCLFEILILIFHNIHFTVSAVTILHSKKMVTDLLLKTVYMDGATSENFVEIFEFLRGNWDALSPHPRKLTISFFLKYLCVFAYLWRVAIFQNCIDKKETIYHTVKFKNHSKNKKIPTNKMSFPN